MATSNYTGQSLIIWIDFNDDQDFDYPGEEILNSGQITYGASQGAYYDTISLPMSASTGYHRLSPYAGKRPVVKQQLYRLFFTRLW